MAIVWLIVTRIREVNKYDLATAIVVGGTIVLSLILYVYILFCY